MLQLFQRGAGPGPEEGAATDERGIVIAEMADPPDNVLQYAKPAAPWWRRRARTILLLALFLVLFLIAQMLDWLGLRPGDFLWGRQPWCPFL
jgi:hypothetical protein